ncbi:1-hydroxycarotenoid 3,4-desaturase CrtD [Mesorhizobium loti]|nr:1-hydroxycarotenoid 3,4-desaturase CrtD [Mesorhizobium loti]
MQHLPDIHRMASNARSAPVVVVGAGMAGLTTALMLAEAGCRVTVVEKSARPGGKLRELGVGGQMIDSGPTVFTMRWVFEAIFASVGERLADHVRLTKADILARHSWQDGSTFDLHADVEQTADAVGRFAGADEALGYRAFCGRTAEVFASLNQSFMENPAPSPIGLALSAGVGGLAALSRIKPFTSLWNVVGDYFRDPRLRQLFGRYATYCGSSPFSAPGPLMLIAQVEQMGVWLVEGGMARLADAFEGLAIARGVEFVYGADVAKVSVRDHRATGVELASGQKLPAEAVVFNGDPAAIFSGLLGEAARSAVPAWRPADRSLSALTWSVHGQARGFPLSRHTVFFSKDYKREFEDLLGHGQLPQDPTIYVCAQDRDTTDEHAAPGTERLFLLVNAPAQADSRTLSKTEIASCEKRVTARLEQAGLTLSVSPENRVVTTPSDFNTLFPGTGGALYGRSSHGWAASFQRPGSRTRIKGLYLAGGAVHPGPGLPMAALSGRHAATAILRDLASTVSFHPMAMPGGMSTRSAATDSAH